MVSYVHSVFVTCYFCYMFSLGPSSGSTGSVRIYRSAYEDNVQTGGVFRVRYMLFNAHLCNHIVDTSYYCKVVVGLRAQFCTLLEV